MRSAPALVLLLALAGCSSGTVTQSDNAKVKAEFSQEEYEKAMKKAGRGAELEAEKAAAAKRGEP